MKMITQLVVVVLSALHLGVALRTGLVPSRHAEVVAFSQRSYATVGLPALVHRRQPNFWLLKSTENPNEEATTTGQLQNRRRRRKQQSPLGNVVASQTNEVEEVDDEEDDDDEELNSSLTPRFELKPRDSAGVALEVKDVRAVVGLIPQDNVNTPQREGQQRQPSISSTRSTSSSSSSTSTGLNTADSLERMLADARQMQLQEDENEGDDDKESEGVNIPTTIRGILSTIVTIDFFVIIGFLGWFLAGVFASSVLKNDDIQIAFNNNFSGLVQPALGLLMVLSIASAFFKDPEEGEEQ